MALLMYVMKGVDNQMKKLTPSPGKINFNNLTPDSPKKNSVPKPGSKNTKSVKDEDKVKKSTMKNIKNKG